MRLTWFKKHCLICTKSIQDQESLCLSCMGRMQHVSPKEICRSCGVVLVVQDQLCGACQNHPPYFDRVQALWVYDDLSSHLIQRLKFYEDFTVLPFLVNSFAKVLMDTDLPDAIIPVPLHYTRLFKRGFNQAGEIAKRLAKTLNVPVDDRMLRKVKKTKAQASLHESDRHQNIKSAFIINAVKRYQSVAIVDDVMTTGSTLNEMAKIIKKSGVERVDAWVMSRAIKR